MARDPRAPKAYRGFEVFFSELRMSFRMYVTMLKMCMLLQAFFIFMMYDVVLSTKWEREVFFQFAYSGIMAMTSPDKETSLTFFEPGTKYGTPEKLTPEQESEWEPEVYETTVQSMFEYLTKGEYFKTVKMCLIKIGLMLASS